jgi:hypothetical protein
MANKKNEDKYVGAFLGGGVGGVLGVLGGPIAIAFGGGIGAWLGYEIERWLVLFPQLGHLS